MLYFREDIDGGRRRRRGTRELDRERERREREEREKREEKGWSEMGGLILCHRSPKISFLHWLEQQEQISD